MQRRAAQPEAQDPLEARAVHPAGRAGVPGPSPASHVRALGVDVGGGDVGLDLVAVESRARGRVVDRVQEREELARLVAFVQLGEGDDRPDRAVRVLSAVLAHSGQIPLDVTGIEGRPVEGGREEEHQPVAAAHEVFLDGRHGAAAPIVVPGAGEDGPGLRDRVDPALLVLRGAERRSVVEIGAPVPVPVPGFPLDRHLQRVHVRAPPLCPLGVSALPGEPGELPEVGVEEPGEPDALALPLAADAVHSVVPVSGPHQRQAVRPDGEAAVERAGAVLEERPDLGGDLGHEEPLQFLGLQRLAAQERHAVVEHARVPRDLEVVRDGVGEPEQVVGHPGAHARRRTAGATSAARPLPRTGARRRAADARGRFRAGRRSGPSRPGAGRGNRRRRRPGRRRCAPRSGRRGSGRGASGSAGCPWTGRASRSGRRASVSSHIRRTEARQAPRSSLR